MCCASPGQPWCLACALSCKKKSRAIGSALVRPLQHTCATAVVAAADAAVATQLSLDDPTIAPFSITAKVQGHDIRWIDSASNVYAAHCAEARCAAAPPSRVRACRPCRRRRCRRPCRRRVATGWQAVVADLHLLPVVRVVACGAVVIRAASCGVTGTRAAGSKGLEGDGSMWDPVCSNPSHLQTQIPLPPLRLTCVSLAAELSPADGTVGGRVASDDKLARGHSAGGRSRGGEEHAWCKHTAGPDPAKARSLPHRAPSDPGRLGRRSHVGTWPSPVQSSTQCACWELQQHPYPSSSSSSSSSSSGTDVFICWDPPAAAARCRNPAGG